MSPPKSLLKTLTGISFDPLDIDKYWPTGDQWTMGLAANAWQAAHNSLIEIRDRLAVDVKQVTDHSDAPDIDAFGGYWHKIYQDCFPNTLLEALPGLCEAIAKACRDYAHALLEAHTQGSEAVANPIGILIEASAIRAALAAAASKLLQVVGTITVSTLTSGLITSVTTGIANAPDLRILQAETESEEEAEDPNLDRLSEAERDTLGRLRQEHPDWELRASSEERDGEFTDGEGRTYDQMGDPQASQYWSKRAAQKFFRAIDAHLNKSMDYTVIDLNGFSEQAANDIRAYVDSLPRESQEKIIKVGF